MCQCQGNTTIKQNYSPARYVRKSTSVLLCSDVLALEERPKGDPGIEAHVRGGRGETIMGGSAIRMLILGIAQPPIIGFVQNNIRPPISEPALGKQYFYS